MGLFLNLAVYCLSNGKLDISKPDKKNLEEIWVDRCDVTGNPDDTGKVKVYENNEGDWFDVKTLKGLD